MPGALLRRDENAEGPRNGIEFRAQAEAGWRTYTEQPPGGSLELGHSRMNVCSPNTWTLRDGEWNGGSSGAIQKEKRERGCSTYCVHLYNFVSPRIKAGHTRTHPDTESLTNARWTRLTLQKPRSESRCSRPDLAVFRQPSLPLSRGPHAFITYWGTSWG